MKIKTTLLCMLSACLLIYCSETETTSENKLPTIKSFLRFCEDLNDLRDSDIRISMSDTYAKIAMMSEEDITNHDQFLPKFRIAVAAANLGVTFSGQSVFEGRCIETLNDMTFE